MKIKTLSILIFLSFLKLSVWSSEICLAPKSNDSSFDVGFILGSTQLWKVWGESNGDFNNTDYQKLKNKSVKQGLLVHEIEDIDLNTDEGQMMLVTTFGGVLRNWLNSLGSNVENREASNVVTYLVENVLQHGGEKGILFGQLDRENNEILLSVMDLGPGFYSRPPDKKKPYFELREDLTLPQRPGSPGRGLAMERIISNSQALSVFTKGHYWSYFNGRKMTPYTHIPSPDQGALIFTRLKLNDTQIIRRHYTPLHILESAA